MELAVGQKILAWWTDGYWYEATVEAVTDDGVAIVYDDGTQSTVQLDWIVAEQEPTIETRLEVGARIEAMWTDLKWYAGELKAIRGRLFQVAWDDGTLRWVDEAYIRPEGGEPEEEEAPAPEPFVPPEAVPFEVEPAIVAQLERVWRWAHRHAEAAPELTPQGLELDRILAIEREVSFPYPNDLRTLLHFWPAGSSVAQYYFLSPERMVMEHGFFASEAETWAKEVPGDSEAMKVASHGWIPFANDFGSGRLALDLDPGPAGQVGQVVQVYPGDNRPMAASLEALLSEFADMVERGEIEDKDLQFPEEIYKVVAGGGIPEP
ncbi:MAG: SMI1/KNR4 family protein [Deltaproteobacteria bacterium]|nr:SMI1/KNR4 family protein [Deltaproteobacteria bacterium]